MSLLAKVKSQTSAFAAGAKDHAYSSGSAQARRYPRLTAKGFPASYGPLPAERCPAGTVTATTAV